MRRDELIKSMTHISDALINVGAESVIDRFSSNPQEDRGASSVLILEIYSKLQSFILQTCVIEKQIVSLFDLDNLFEVTFWSGLINNGERIDRNQYFYASFSINVFNIIVKRLGVLLDRSSDATIETLSGVNSNGVSENIGVETMRIYVRENTRPDLSVSNLISILQDIRGIYEAIVRVENLQSVDLIVGSIDSGSDKSIDLIGVASAMSKVSDLILQGWDRVRFNKQQKLEKTFKSAGDGIDLIDKINKSLETGSMTEQEAEKLKRGVLKKLRTQ